MINENERDPALVIPARPQIVVEDDGYGCITIDTADIADDFQSVDHERVRIPMEDALAVIAAMQSILANPKG